MKSTLKTLLLSICLVMLISSLSFAQDAKPAAPVDRPAVAKDITKDETIKLGDEDLKEVKTLQESLSELNRSRQEALTAKAATDAQLAAIEAQMREVKARADARKYRVCAKHKPALDPDEWDWAPDLTSLVKKKEAPKP